jgi:hypothetical protein
MAIPDFDQYVEYVTEGPIIHPVALAQHSLESPLSLATVISGYIRANGLGRALVAGAELAFVFSEWTPAGGLPTAPGVVASMVLAGWTAKSIAGAYIMADTATIDAINASRTVALALIRMSLNGGPNPLAYDQPATSQQVTVLSTWLNNHNITNSEFAALFGVTAAQLSNWLQTHPRWQIAQVIHDKFA